MGANVLESRRPFMFGRSLFASLVGLMLLSGVAAEEKVLDGKVVPDSKAGAKPHPAATGVALVTADGAVYPIVETDVSRLLFLDKELHGRAVRLTGTVDPKSKTATVTKVQTVKAGKVFDVDYWCEKCQLAASQPGKCVCCGADVVLRELPVK
jgi:predicted RNA-binding protein with PUA domain